MIAAPKKVKTVNKIKYYSVLTDSNKMYRLWQSDTHPTYKHYTLIKAKK
jgi:hypothetical protein